MAYTTILSEKKSTYGSPYCFYTVQYYEKARSSSAVTLAVRISAHLQYYNSFNGYALTAKLTVEGSTYTIPLKGTETWSGTATHTVDKDISVSASATTTVLGASFSVTCSGANASVLNATGCSNISISRYYTTASVSASGATIGDTVSIALSGKYPPAAVCDVTYKFGKLSGNVGKDISGNALSWDTSKIRGDLLKQIPEASSGTCTLTCVTRNGTSVIGTTSCTLTLNTQEKVSMAEDKVVVTPANDNEFLKKAGIYVAGYSKVKVVSAATPGEGAYITAYDISGLGAVGKTADWTSEILSSAGEKKIIVTATDSRNTTATVTKTINVLEYKNPTMILNVERGTGNESAWAPDVSGEDLKITAVGSVSLVDKGNTGKVSITLDGAPLPDSEWVSGEETVCYVKGKAPNNVTHKVTAVMTDLLGNKSNESIFEIPTAVVNMSMKSEDKGVTFGGYPVQEGFVCEFPAKFNNNIFLKAEAAGFDKAFAEKCEADENGLVSIKKLILNMMYPVGSYYWSSEATNPKDLFGGTWEKIEGRFVLAAGSAYPVGSSGGEATVTLTASNMPTHTHSVTGTAASAGSHWHQMGADLDAVYSTSGTRSYSIHGGTSGAGYIRGYTTTTGAHTHKVTGTAASTGGGTAHNNMPPYIAAYCWRRTE